MIRLGLSLALTRAAGLAASSAVAPTNTVAPAVSGSASVGSTLTTTDGTWTGDAPIVYTYQWKRAGVSIGAATNGTYVTVDADIGASVTCVVTATNVGGATPATSNGTTVTAIAPVNTVAPVVTGSATVGNVLTTTTGTWTGDPTPTFTYQWKRDGSSIGAATNSTYTTVSADVGTSVTCAVTGTNSGGNATGTSNGTSVVGIAPVNTVAPVASGTVTIGGTLSCTTGTWTGTPTPTYAYQWKNGGSNATGTGNATASYTPVAADMGPAITCSVTATNVAGFATQASNALTYNSLRDGGKSFRADDLAASPVTTWADRGSGGKTLTAISTPTWAASQLNGHADVTTSSGKFLRAATAADWPELQDGTGGTVRIVTRQTTGGVQWMAGTLGGSGINKGASLITLGSGNTRWVGGNAAATVFQIDTAGGQLAVNVWHVVIAKYKTGGSPAAAVLRIDRVQVGTGAQANTPATGAPVGPFTLGGISNASGSNYVGDIAEVECVPVFTTAADDADYEAYVLNRYGI